MPEFGKFRPMLTTSFGMRWCRHITFIEKCSTEKSTKILSSQSSTSTYFRRRYEAHSWITRRTTSRKSICSIRQARVDHNKEVQTKEVGKGQMPQSKVEQQVICHIPQIRVLCSMRMADKLPGQIKKTNQKRRGERINGQ